MKVSDAVLPRVHPALQEAVDNYFRTYKVDTLRIRYGKWHYSFVRQKERIKLRNATK